MDRGFTSPSQKGAEICAAIARGLVAVAPDSEGDTGAGLAAGLSALLSAAEARAAGLWLRSRGELRLLGFCAAPDMPTAVAASFRAATLRVSLDESGLGIVKAAVSASPAVGRVSGTDLAASAGWLQSFGATQSLALPIAHEGHVVGVIAISRRDPFDPGSRPWEILACVAGGLALPLKRIEESSP